MRTQACTEDQFLSDVKDHALTIIRDDGVSRHMRFRRPGTMCYGFDIIAWPGYLCYTGDMGCFVFQRVDDMLTFFRGKSEGPLSINLGYWSEKLEAAQIHGGFEKFSNERFIERVWEVVAEDEDATDEMRHAIKDALQWCETPQDLHNAIRDFEWNGETYFSDVWEWNCNEYDFRFVWCCYAIVWGIRVYDEFKKVK